MLTANIKNIIRLRINSDGDGVRSVVFVYGCPLNCFWCCNPETHNGDNYKTLTTKQLHEYIKKDAPYYLFSGGGLTFSGGEPLAYSHFIKEYKMQYGANFSINIETSLFSNRDAIEELIPVIDEWFIDFKVFDEKKHIEYTDKSNESIKNNLVFLANRIDHNKITITYPLVPGYNLSDENIRDMIAFLNAAKIKKIELHPYRKESERKRAELGIPITEVSKMEMSMIQAIEKTFLDSGFEIIWRNAVLKKDKCNYLKQIRRNICKRHNIPLEIKECTFVGRCKGTCPQCESELENINKAL